MAFEHLDGFHCQLVAERDGEAVGPLPHEGDVAGHAAKARATRRQAQAKIPVRLHQQRRVEAAHARERRPADQDRVDMRRAMVRHFMERIDIDWPRLLHRVDRLAIEGHGAPAAMKDLNLGGFAGGGREAVKIAGREQVVGVEEEHEIAAQVGKRGVPCCAFATVWLAMDRDRAAVAGEDRRSGVGRAVVDHDQLERRAFLGEHTVDRVGDKRLAVIDRDDDAYQRQCQRGNLDLSEPPKIAAPNGNS